MLLAASQIASSLTHLKSKYIKYLETLCAANGIDISTLKCSGGGYHQLEMFFGGLPVLIGLKYFENLTSLRLFGQHISCVKPLSEVANTLEELWICEGTLKDVHGLEHCVKLRRLFLYENQLEDATPIGSLGNIEVLHLQDNRLKSLEFLHNLSQLTSLNLAGNKLGDSEMATVSVWPMKLQQIDLSGNSFRSFRSLFTLSGCVSIRHLSIASPALHSNHITENDAFLGWVAHCFRFVESLDDDDVSEQFTAAYLPLTELRVADSLNALLRIEEKLQKDIKLVEKHSIRVESRLGKLCEALEKLRDTLPGKDGKREVVKRVLEAAHSNLRAVKPTKKNFCSFARFKCSLARFRLSMDLECSGIHPLRDGNQEEKAILTQILNFNCSMKHAYEVFIKSCTICRSFTKSDSDRLFLIDRSEQSRLFDTGCLLNLLDRHLTSEYRTTAVRIYRDIELMRKEAKEKMTVFFCPVVLHKNAGRYSRTTAPSAQNIDGSPRGREEQPIVTSEDKAMWREIRIVAIICLEIRYPGQLHTDHLRHNDQFDASFEDQQRKLKEMSIRLDLKEDKLRRHQEDVSEATIESLSTKASKVKKVKDILNAAALNRRWSDDPAYCNCLTIRNPVEIILAYGRNRPIADINELQSRITTLNLSSMKLTKLGGIEELENLERLDLRDNKLTSLKKLRSLASLEFLDASGNNISKLDVLPSSLVEVNLSNNRLSSLHFCQTLQILERLCVSGNQIRSLKGIENCKQLETLMAADNQIKEKADTDYFKSCPKLWFVDLTGNVITTLDGYRNRIHLLLPYLLSLDREQIPHEERSQAHKRTGRGLTMELIEKCYPEWSEICSLALADHKLEIIVLDSPSIERLQHITHIDLSSNHLQQVRELAELCSLKKLILSGNAVRLLWSPNQNEQETAKIPFPSLETLDLSENELTHSLLPRLGICHLAQLKEINLSGNNIGRLDSALFDLPQLSSIDLRNNQIKWIKRKPLPRLIRLYLDGNRLNQLDGLAANNIEILSIANNRLSTCSALKPISEMTSLVDLNCAGNPVTERRVYVDFVKTQVPHLAVLDGKNLSDLPCLPEVRNIHQQMAINYDESRRQSLAAPSLPSFSLSSLSLPSQFRRPSVVSFSIEGSQISLKPIRGTKFSRLDPINHYSDDYFPPSSHPTMDHFVLRGSKAIKHHRI